jgi:hypothetical protein
MENVGPANESGMALMAAHEAAAPAEQPATAADVFGGASQDTFTPTVVPEQSLQEAPPVEVPSPLTAPAAAPVPPAQPEWQQAIQQLQAQAAQERQAFLETLQRFAPKPEPTPEVEPDYLAMLPPEMRNEANLPTAKYMYQMAKAQADAVRQELKQQADAQGFQQQVHAAHQSAQQVVQTVASKGFDFSVPGGDKATTAIETLAKAYAARWGGDPAQYGPQILELADTLARARIGGQIAQSKQRTALQAPASRVPPMHGAPGTSPSQLPGAKRQEVPTEAAARAQGFHSLADWYAKNM